MKTFVIYCPHLNRDIRPILRSIPDPQIWTGYPTTRGEDGCLQCHQAIVAKAKREGWQMVCVLEDDCAFTETFTYAHWVSAAHWAWRHDYDVLVGGSTRTYGEKAVSFGGSTSPYRVDHAFIEVEAFHSAHCVVYLASGYDTILKTVQPHDLSIGQLGARCVLTWPFVAVQAPSYSGILKQPVDYVPLYEAHEKRLGHALGLLEPQMAMGVY